MSLVLSLAGQISVSDVSYFSLWALSRNSNESCFFVPRCMMLCTVVSSAVFVPLIRDCVVTKGGMDDFVRDHDTFAWYLHPAAGSGVLAGTVPVDPVCLSSGAWATHLHFDLSLSDYVVDDALHNEMVHELRGKQHCSLISASGAGKTKAALDLLKVRVLLKSCAGVIWTTTLPPLDCFALVVRKNCCPPPPPPCPRPVRSFSCPGQYWFVHRRYSPYRCALLEGVYDSLCD